MLIFFYKKYEHDMQKFSTHHNIYYRAIFFYKKYEHDMQKFSTHHNIYYRAVILRRI